MGTAASNFNALVASVSFGIAVAAAGILADDLFSRRVRCGLVFLGFCSVLVGVCFF